VRRAHAGCLAIDSTAGLELAVSGGRGVRDLLWRVLDLVSGAGVTTWLNGSADLAPLVDDVLELRRGDREHALSVLKMRSSQHALGPHPYEIAHGGIRLIEPEPNTRRNGHGARLALTQPA
jgi:hypothetical protein